jgi:hypothetical protein
MVLRSQRQPLAQRALQAVAPNVRRELVAAALQALQRWRAASKARPWPAWPASAAMTESLVFQRALALALRACLQAIACQA